MDLAQFWKLVDAVRSTAGDDMDARCEILCNELEQLSKAQLQAFQQRYEQMLINAKRWDLLAAAYIINDGCSDNSFRHFLDWLISEGSTTYQAALANPDILADLPAIAFPKMDEFGDCALQVFEDKYDGDLGRDFMFDMEAPVGEEWSDEDLPRLLPRLAARYAFTHENTEH